jgi:hypothetical protein
MAGLVLDAIIGTGGVMASEAFGAAGLLATPRASGGVPGLGWKAGVFFINRVITVAGELFGAAEGTIGLRLGPERAGGFG